MKYSLRSQKFAISAAIATLGTSIMLLCPASIIAFIVGPSTLLSIGYTLLFERGN